MDIHETIIIYYNVMKTQSRTVTAKRENSTYILLL